MLGFIVYAPDTYYLPTNMVNIRELLNIDEHNLSIIGKVFEQCSIA